MGGECARERPGAGLKVLLAAGFLAAAGVLAWVEYAHCLSRGRTMADCFVRSAAVGLIPLALFILLDALLFLRRPETRPVRLILLPLALAVLAGSTLLLFLF